MTSGDKAMGSPCVLLTPCEVAMGEAVAHWRVDRVQREQRGHGHGERREVSLVTHVPGALAELAVAKYYGVYFDGGAEQWSSDDVVGFQVRATTHRDGHLIVYGTDPPDAVCLLVRTYQNEKGQCLCYLHGTLRASEAITHYPKKTLRPGSPEQFWVPQTYLDPVPTPVLQRKRPYERGEKKK